MHNFLQIVCRWFSRARLVLFLAPFAISIGVAAGQSLVSDIAKPVHYAVGAPRYSDVSMRLFVRLEDQAEITVAKEFHITRVDWSYTKDKSYIEKIHELGWTFQGSMSAITNSSEQALKTADGKPLLDHFNVPGRYWADSHKSSYRESNLKELKQWVALGVDSIQRDEPDAIGHWTVPDAVDFFRSIHTRLKKDIGRDITISVNLSWNEGVFAGLAEPLAELFDFGMSEITKQKINPQFFWRVSQEARKTGKFIVYTTYEDLGLSTYRQAIAASYANGLLFMVPWDQFAGVDKPRVFSKPDDLADLYGFVRGNHNYLDGYEEAVIAGYGLQETRWGGDPPVKLEASDTVSAWIRAKPGNHQAPVVIHLVDWGTSKNFKVKFRARAFFEDGSVSVELRTPRRYDSKLHAKAESNKTYDILYDAVQLPVVVDNGWYVVNVNGLTPWGVLILTRK